MNHVSHHPAPVHCLSPIIRILLPHPLHNLRSTVRALERILPLRVRRAWKPASRTHFTAVEAVISYRYRFGSVWGAYILLVSCCSGLMLNNMFALGHLIRVLHFEIVVDALKVWELLLLWDIEAGPLYYICVRVGKKRCFAFLVFVIAESDNASRFQNSGTTFSTQRVLGEVRQTNLLIHTRAPELTSSIGTC